MYARAALVALILGQARQAAATACATYPCSCAVALKPWMDAQINSWELTTATNCGVCESALNKASPNNGTINSADECWLDCLRTYVNDDFDDETLWAIDWYPATKACKCQSSCDTLGLVDDPVVVITRENYFFPPGC